MHRNWLWRSFKAVIILGIFAALLSGLWNCISIFHTHVEVKVDMTCAFSPDGCKNYLFWHSYCENEYRVDPDRLARCRDFVARLGKNIRQQEGLGSVYPQSVEP